MSDDQGLYNKYHVTKTNGEPVDPGAQYLVLRIDTDPQARTAAIVYADQIRHLNPELAAGIKAWVERYSEGPVVPGEFRLEANILAAYAPRPVVCEGCGNPIDEAPYLVKVWAPINVRENWHAGCYAREHRVKPT